MSKRNFILLIIILILTIIAIIGFLYFQSNTTVKPGEESTGTNFISQFNPFGNGKPTPPAVTPPDSGEDTPPDNNKEVPIKKIMRVSSMPIAGFTVFTKERLKEVPITAPTATLDAPYDFGSTTLKDGSTGEAVKEVQRFLNNTLNLSLELDGVLDAGIVTAIKKWQSANELIADGIIGTKTKAIMYSSVNQETKTTKSTPPPTEFVPALRYVDKATGNIYQTFVDKIKEVKFSTTIIPKIYEAYFGNHGGSVVMRYLKNDDRTIETFVGTLPKEILGGDTIGDNELKGFFLPNNVKDISISPDNLKVFYLFTSENNQNGNTTGVVLNLSNNKKNQIFDSPFTEWLSFWPTSNTITLTTKPSAYTPGYMYSIDGTGKNLTKILGDIKGLTTLENPNGKLILVSDNNLSTSIYHTDTKSSDKLSIKTLPEKCVWNKTSDTIYCAIPKSIERGAYPDTWYQGEVSFSDQLWKIDIKTGNGTLILDPATIADGEEVDGTNLKLDEGENYLFFVNKKDSFLWKLDLK